MPTAICEVTLPVAPSQLIEQAKRVVTVQGGVGDGAIDVGVSSQGPVTVRADLQAAVTVSVVEVLVNGKQSSACSVQFTPASLVEATAADPAGFAVKLTKVE